MKISDFLALLSKPERTNYFVLAPDQLGLNLLLQKALESVATSEDVQFHEAGLLTKERARQLEAEARMGPRGGSKYTHFYISKLQNLPVDSVGPLLKAVEEARFARFIFQAQRFDKKIETLKSRSVVVKIAFLTRKAVLANMKLRNLDARTADELNLYDGTLAGTIRNLAMKDTLMSIKRDLKSGVRGRAVMFNQNTLNSDAFEPALDEFLLEEERRFLDATRSSDGFMGLARKRILMYAVTQRISS